jgi:beta-N-acetylhexosaminidase
MIRRNYFIEFFTRLNKVSKISLWIVWIVSFILLTLFPNTTNARQNAFEQRYEPSPQIQSILESMTPEEKIGQLFIVTFSGNTALPGSAVEQLITNYHVGGFVLLTRNDNFSDEVDILKSTQDLITQLQQTEWNASQSKQENVDTVNQVKPAYIPLFIGISQEGDNAPYDQIYSGLTTITSQMTIGATWKTDYAKQAGIILGNELEQLGINLLLGPSLDILEIPHPEVDVDMGTRTFGGDSFWVSQMGQSFVDGLHNGGRNRVAIIAKHFPGYGSADRIPEEEVATVRKSLNELRNFDMVPFFTVTGDAPDPANQVDGLLVSHIRYQGFQDNAPRAITRPISLDQSALQALVSEEPIAEWRSNGGILITDDLGGHAMRRYLDLISQSFDPRRVLLNALLAGNDLLYVSDFTSQEQEDNLTATISTLSYFSQKYIEDQSFAQRVDDAVARIISLKLNLYKNFIPSQVYPSTPFDSDQESYSQQLFNITREAVTLINPTEADLDEVLPDPPKRTDRMVFITDSRTIQQCSKCIEVQAVPVNALQDIVLKRYGPSAGRLIVGSNLYSHSVSEIEALLNNRASKEVLERRIGLAHWIIFVMTDNSDDYASYKTLSRFLAQRPDLIQGKKLILFSLNAPYYLDATDIVKFTAFFNLYNKTHQALDIAAYLLFGEISATGALPVSVPSINYSLNEALFPDPNQIIQIAVEQPESIPNSSDSGESTPQPPPFLEIGDVININTGPIFDRNGRPVPDGTPVEFTLASNNDSQVNRQIEYTSQGISETSFMVTTTGSLEIRAQSEQAVSNIIRLEVPTQPETTEPTATHTITSTPEPTPTETVTPTPTPASSENQSNSPGMFDWAIAILISSILGWITFWLSANAGYFRWGVRMGLLVFCGGVLSYIYLVMRWPGADIMVARSVSQGVLLSSILGCLSGLIIASVWLYLHRKTRPSLE